jgi:hypothetical protein
MRAELDGSAAPLTFSNEERARLRSDFPYFCERLLKINPKVKELVQARAEGDNETPRGPLIPFVWNEAQREVWRVMLEMIARGVSVKLVILKARQVGISTFFCAYIFWLMWRQLHTRAGIVAFEKKTTLAELNETMATFYEALPAGYKPRLRQHRKDGSGRVGKEEMYFDDRKANLQFVVQSPGAMRGVARDAVLCTEVSFYKEPEQFFGGFLPVLSESSTSLLILESSPEDGYFRDAYEIAKAGGTDRRAVFIPWWMVTDLYSRSIIRRGRRMYDGKDPNREIVFTPAVRKHQRAVSRMAQKIGRPPITDEQMWWWLNFCESNYQGDDEWMRQEFPDDDVTAFQRASKSAFKAALPIVAETVGEVREIYPDAQAGLLTSTTYHNFELDQIVVFEPEQKEGWIDQERRPGLVLLEAPRLDYTYVIGADVADEEGEDDEEGERAFSVGTVYCCNTREQVAWYRGHLDPTDWGDELVKLGYFFNTALLVVERNNMGRLTEHRIRTLRYPPHRRFRWPDWNVGPHALTKKEMWETNTTTKMMMMGALRQWLRDRFFIVRDPGLHDELAHYRIVNGRFQAKDRPADRIIAAALCVQGVEQTEFAFKNIVLGGANVRAERSAHGMAARILRTAKAVPPPSDELPDEFDGLGMQRVTDIFAAAGF